MGPSQIVRQARRKGTKRREFPMDMNDVLKKELIKLLSDKKVTYFAD
jgi:hypothetical protein